MNPIRIFLICVAALLACAGVDARAAGPVLRPLSVPGGNPAAAVDAQQAELARLNAETRNLAGQITGKLAEIRAAQERQWRGPRSCQGPLVMWNQPAEGGSGFPLPAFDCSPYLCEAPGFCSNQCISSTQCASGAHCLKTANGGICAPAN